MACSFFAVSHTLSTNTQYTMHYIPSLSRMSTTRLTCDSGMNFTCLYAFCGVRAAGLFMGKGTLFIIFKPRRFVTYQRKKKKDKKERKEESKKWQIQRDTQWGIVNQNILSSLFELSNKLNNKMRCRATPPTQTFLWLVTKSSPKVSATCGKERVTNS